MPQGLTEDEAKTRWCPFANVHIPYQNTGSGGNRALGKSKDMQGWEGDALCIAGRCMAWRNTGQIGIGPNGERRDRDLDGKTRWKDTGFCGLAGPLSNRK